MEKCHVEKPDNSFITLQFVFKIISTYIACILCSEEMIIKNIKPYQTGLTECPHGPAAPAFVFL